MTTSSKLRQVLSIFENTDEPLRLPQIARDLDIPTERLDGMIQHWVRKGKLREVVNMTDCGSCGRNGGCPFVLELPRSYELVRETDGVFIPLLPAAACRQATSAE